MQGAKIALTGLAGDVLQLTEMNGTTAHIDMRQYADGMYLVVLYDSNGNKWVEKVSKHS